MAGDIERDTRELCQLVAKERESLAGGQCHPAGLVVM